MAEVSLTEIQEQAQKRFDPEYFNQTALIAAKKLDGARDLGSFVKEGYRVVYENTEAIEVDDISDLPYFLQSSDITTPFINTEAMIRVSESEWLRYPKGRIRIGELLIEVKGKAEKIAIVPDDFPRKTLVTGTCFKLTTKNDDDKYIIAVFLLCKYGLALKERLKTNLLVSYIAKDDLYSIPIPSVNKGFLQEIKRLYINSVRLREEAHSHLQRAETLLLSELGLEHWQPPAALTYERNAKEVFGAGRIDAEYFYPAKAAAIQHLQSFEGVSLRELFTSIRNFWNPADTESNIKVQNYDLTAALSPFLDPWHEAQEVGEIGSTKKLLQQGDLVVSRLRSYLREIATVSHSYPGLMVGSSEFIVLRPTQKDLTSEALGLYLRSQLPQTILKWSQDGANHPRFNQDELLSIHVPEKVLALNAQLTEIAMNIQNSVQHSTQLLSWAKRAVEIAIEESETAAMTYLTMGEHQ